MSLRRLGCLVWLSLIGVLPAQAQSWTFGVNPQRSATLTAEYWNPLLDYLQRRTGIALSLTFARTGEQTLQAIEQGEYDFVYSNQVFLPTARPVGYRVVLRPRSEPIHAQIVTLTSSPLTRLDQLRGRRVGFASTASFVAYRVTQAHLDAQGIAVEPVFGGTQEGTMVQLQVGRVSAIAVNDRIMREFAAREHLAYRPLWTSAAYPDQPIAAHPRVPAAIRQAVQRAFAQMHLDPEGATILRRAAAVIGQRGALGFDVANDDDYAGYLLPLGATRP